MVRCFNTPSHRETQVTALALDIPPYTTDLTESSTPTDGNETYVDISIPRQGRDGTRNVNIPFGDTYGGGSARLGTVIQKDGVTGMTYVQKGPTRNEVRVNMQQHQALGNDGQGRLYLVNADAACKKAYGNPLLENIYYRVTNFTYKVRNGLESAFNTLFPSIAP